MNKIDNYIKYREKLVDMISKGAVCYNCLAKPMCKLMCLDMSIDPSTSPAPCKEAWEQWLKQTD